MKKVKFRDNKCKIYRKKVREIKKVNCSSCPNTLPYEMKES